MSSRRLSAIVFALALAAALLPQFASAAPPSSSSYIVVLKDSVSSPGAVASEHARKHGAQVSFVYTHAIKGYAGMIPEGRLAAIRRDARVSYVEADGPVSIVHHLCGHTGGPPGSTPPDCPEEPPPEEPPPEEESPPPAGVCDRSGQTVPWGIGRVGATPTGDPCNAVGNVHVYIIDTGADASHPDLNVVNHVNFAGGPNKDCHGHGTHVAGTVAAKDNSTDVVGVAPGAPVTGVKVLSCSGSGSWSGVIKGVDWVTANAVKPAIANMSLGGGANNSVDAAVKKSADSGVFYSIAAGNSGADACNYSPARAGTHNGVMTVAATDSNDQEASWSNYGPCVDVWAPGVRVLSTKSGGGTTTMSGTSMAAPHAGGAGAIYLSSSSETTSAANVESALLQLVEELEQQSKDDTLIDLLSVIEL